MNAPTTTPRKNRGARAVTETEWTRGMTTYLRARFVLVIQNYDYLAPNDAARSTLWESAKVLRDVWLDACSTGRFILAQPYMDR